MPENNKFEKRSQDYSDLIFDWGNPQGPVKKAPKTPAPEKAPAAGRPAGGSTEAVLREAPAKAPASPAAASRSLAAGNAAARSSAAGNAAAKAPAEGKKTAARFTRSGAKQSDRNIRKDEAGEAGDMKAKRREMMKRRRARAIRNRIIAGVVVLAVLAGIVFLVFKLGGAVKNGTRHATAPGFPEYVIEDYLPVNSYSRPGISTHTITGIVVHNTAEPGMSAKERRDYFESLSEGASTRASVNFIVGLEGEVIMCIPPGEVAYASNDRNLDTVSVEFCQPDETGALSDETYAAMVQLLRWLCDKYGLEPEAVIRHYDITGKLCPKYYVENPEAWEKLISDVKGA